MSQEKILLVYDKQCPACHYYSRMVRISETAGELQLVDAREPSEVMNEITYRGLDIDQGMVLKMHGRLYYGADAIHRLALISSRSGILNRLNYWLFKFSVVAASIYPVLEFLRKFILKKLGVTKINNLQLSGSSKF